MSLSCHVHCCTDVTSHYIIAVVLCSWLAPYNSISGICQLPIRDPYVTTAQLRNCLLGDKRSDLFHQYITTRSRVRKKTKKSDSNKQIVQDGGQTKGKQKSERTKTRQVGCNNYLLHLESLRADLSARGDAIEVRVQRISMYTEYFDDDLRIAPQRCPFGERMLDKYEHACGTTYLYHNTWKVPRLSPLISTLTQ